MLIMGRLSERQTDALAKVTYQARHDAGPSLFVYRHGTSGLTFVAGRSAPTTVSWAIYDYFRRPVRAGTLNTTTGELRDGWPE